MQSLPTHYGIFPLKAELEVFQLPCQGRAQPSDGASIWRRVGVLVPREAQDASRL